MAGTGMKTGMKSGGFATGMKPGWCQLHPGEREPCWRCNIAVTSDPTGPVFAVRLARTLTGDLPLPTVVHRSDVV